MTPCYVDIYTGTVYPALRRLENADYVASKWERQSIAQAEQRPPRKYYEVTKAGRTALAEARQRFRLLAQLEPLASDKPANKRANVRPFVSFVFFVAL